MITRRVRAMVIVVVQPAIQLFAALSFRGIAAGVGPTVSQGSVKAFHLAVGLWAVRSCPSVRDTGVSPLVWWGLGARDLADNGVAARQGGGPSRSGQ